MPTPEEEIVVRMFGNSLDYLEQGGKTSGATAFKLPSGKWLAVINDDDMAVLTAMDEAREEEHSESPDGPS